MSPNQLVRCDVSGNQRRKLSVHEFPGIRKPLLFLRRHRCGLVGARYSTLTCLGRARGILHKQDIVEGRQFERVKRRGLAPDAIKGLAKIFRFESLAALSI
jgi:hypothetical protein